MCLPIFKNTQKTLFLHQNQWKNITKLDNTEGNFLSLKNLPKFGIYWEYFTFSVWNTLRGCLRGHNKTSQVGGFSRKEENSWILPQNNPETTCKNYLHKNLQGGASVGWEKEILGQFCPMLWTF